MRRDNRSLPRYLLLFFTLFFLITVPLTQIKQARSLASSFFFPVWNVVSLSHSFFLSFFQENITSINAKHSFPELSIKEEVLRLQLENSLMETELVRLQHLLQNDPSLEFSNETTDVFSDSIKQHKEELTELFQFEMQAIPAKVIFREMGSWNSSIWVNVGSSTNKKLKREVITKNSPVLFGSSVIGVVDEVKENKSLVRLITDQSLNPSVRVARGKQQNDVLFDQLRLLWNMVSTRSDLFNGAKEQWELQENLKKIIDKIKISKETLYLAKGELLGSSGPSWRQSSCTLVGSGFNFDYSDERGEARDLRTGQLLKQQGNNKEKQEILPLVKQGDLLVTTGMDGVFPPDLPVAKVTHVEPLKEGAYYFDIEAEPVAGNLQDLSLVFIIPSME